MIPLIFILLKKRKKKTFAFPGFSSLQKELFCFSSLEAMATEVDVVTVATPASTHFSIVKTLLEKGVHVLVEKPLATCWKEGEALVRLAESQNLLLAVGYSERCHPLLIQSFPFLKQMKELFFCRETQESQRGGDVDVILDLMVHDLDILCGLWWKKGKSLMDLKKVQVCKAQGQRDKKGLLKTAWVQLLFPEGQRATLRASRAAEEARRFCFGLEREQQLLLDFANHSLRLDGNGTCDVAKTKAPSAPSSDSSPSWKEWKLDTFPDNLMVEVSQFVKAVRNEGNPTVSGREALGSLFLAQAIEEFYDSN